MAGTFPGVIAFSFMVSLILLGVGLRARIRLLQIALVPASLIAGIAGFTLINLDLSFGFKSSDFTAFAFHFFTLSFMSLVLTGKEVDRDGGENSSVIRGGSWLSVVWVMSLVLQGLTGIGVIILYDWVTGSELSYFLGAIATHGFTQGPGQALALGSIWESELGIQHAIDFGLIYASAGFVAAFLIGVPVARYAISRGMNWNKAAVIDEEFLSGLTDSESNPSSGRQVTHAANVDSLAFHLAILGLAYLLTDVYLKFAQGYASEIQFGDVNLGLFFSHNLFFLHGLMVCLLLRSMLDRLGLGHLIDNDTQKRITGSSVDLMVVGTIMSIQFALLATYIVPIFLTCLAISIVTAILCFGAARSLGTFSVERAVTIFGCCTGSTGSGLLLLRILDPDFSTPIAKELAFFNIAIIFLAFHILTMMAPILPTFSLMTICIVYTVTFLLGTALLTVANRVKWI
ncbi:MAG: ESS family glutamate:Na+ symporter [Candidatus Azotimanducaceae bacterium]|jgi:ESS family glutamate:Na+ symporter